MAQSRLRAGTRGGSKNMRLARFFIERPRLRDDVQRLGVQVRKATPSILLGVNIYSRDTSRDTLYLSNYTTLHIKDTLARLQGVGDVQFQGAREYAMRIWLEPDKVAE